jgi:hypothetical protein
LQRFLQPLKARLETSSELVITGIRHSLIVLDITSGKGKENRGEVPRADVTEDVEAADNVIIPGRSDFASHFQEELYELYSR